LLQRCAAPYIGSLRWRGPSCAARFHHNFRIKAERLRSRLRLRLPHEARAFSRALAISLLVSPAPGARTTPYSPAPTPRRPRRAGALGARAARRSAARFTHPLRAFTAARGAGFRADDVADVADVAL
jgi:hypothetical protein